MTSYAFTVPFRPVFDGNGLPIAGAQADFTLTGTTTPASIYSDSGLSVPMTNPVIADAAGRFPRVYMNSATTYRVRFFAADADIATDTPLEDFDPYSPVEVGSQGPQGTNATVLSGTVNVTTLSSGASATASVASLGGGTYQLSLGIPQGPAGATTGATWGSITGTLSSQGDLSTALGLKAPLASPTFTGTPAAPTAATGTNTTQVATTAFVQQELAAAKTFTVPIMAAGMTARTTSGAASGTAESTTNKVMTRTLDFDASAIEYAQFSVLMPKQWNEGTITADFDWTATNTGDVVWAIQAVAISDGDVIDAAFGTAVTVTDSVIAANDKMRSPTTSAMTVAGTPADNDLVVFQVYRNATSGADTCAVDARLIGVRLFITTNAKDDS